MKRMQDIESCSSWELGWPTPNSWGEGEEEKESTYLTHSYSFESIFCTKLYFCFVFLMFIMCAIMNKSTE